MQVGRWQIRRPERRWPPGWLYVLGAGALPGLLIGVQLAGLIFFLNPHLSLAPLSLAGSALLYGAMFGLASLLVALPFLAGRPQRARRFLPWGMTAALLCAAVLDWTHASIFTYFLPPGMNKRLIKAALWLSLAAVIAFYTALLHTLRGRRYGFRSRLAFAVLALASIYVMVERREAFRPRPEPGPLPSAVETAERPRLYVIGIEGASMEALLPLAEQGHLPFLAEALRQGAHGRLRSLTPNTSYALWTTLATGKYPYKHGVLGERTYTAGWLAPEQSLKILPEGIGFGSWGFVEEVRGGRSRRQALTLWEILPRLGVDRGLVDWPGSSTDGGSAGPASTGNGFLITEDLFSGPADTGAGASGEVEARTRLFEIAPEELDPVLVSRFGERPPAAVLGALAQDLWRQSLGTFLLEQYRDVEAVFVYLPGLGEVSRRYFGGYVAAQFEGAQAREYLQAARILSAYYAQLDGYLARLWEQARSPKILVVVSAYGVEEPRGWRQVMRELAGGRPVEGYIDRSPDGALLLYGEGIEPGAALTDARLVDLAPTVLYALGFPIARDLDGRILTGSFERSFLARHPLTFLPSYETLTETAASPPRP